MLPALLSNTPPAAAQLDSLSLDSRSNRHDWDSQVSQAASESANRPPAPLPAHPGDAA
jgi:hypothetical protein